MGILLAVLTFQELANPIVRSHLEFIPHETLGRNIFASYQSAKWLKCLSWEYRVQMVEVRGKHFYIYEPLALSGGDQSILIPIYFYKYRDFTFAKCIKPQLVKLQSPEDGTMYTAITIPGDLYFNSPVLVDVDVDEFLMTYSEIRLSDGSPLVDSCKEHIVGKVACL